MFVVRTSATVFVTIGSKLTDETLTKHPRIAIRVRSIGERKWQTLRRHERNRRDRADPQHIADVPDGNTTLPIRLHQRGFEHLLFESAAPYRAEVALAVTGHFKGQAHAEN